MRKFFLILFSFSILFGQEFAVEQLTDIKGKVKNPVFPQFELNWPGNLSFSLHPYETNLFFEHYVKTKSDTNSNIAYLKFNYDERAFEEELFYLTNNSFIQKNISVTAFPKYYVMWQTNKNGNWDIEYTVRLDDTTWSEPKILIGTEEDETNPEFINMIGTVGDNEFRNTIWFTFERDNKVYLAEFEDSLKNLELVYTNQENFLYSNAQSCLTDPYDKEIYVASERFEPGNENKQIVLTHKNIETGVWNDEVVISDSANSHNPKFIQFGFTSPGPYFLSFEIETEERNSVNIAYDEDYENLYSKGLTELETNPAVNTYGLFSYIYLIVTKQSSSADIDFYFPFIYKQVQNDSTFVVMGQGYYDDNKILVHVKNDSTGFTVGPVAAYPEAMLSYMVWTDVTSNGTNLFGAKRYDDLGAVNENSKLKKSITLFQNYPNPFNPTTTIKFAIPSVERPYRASLQTKLIVYDILGREVKTLLNKPMPPGEYEIEFDGSNLPSGVYLYRLTASEYIKTRKMVLIK